MGNDVSWKAIVDVLDPQERVENSVGLLGRAGQDADSLGTLTSLLREAGITTFAFPAGHLDEMAKIVQAEYLCPIQLVPYQTGKRLNERFGAGVEFIEMPVGIEGTSRFLRGVADLTGNQKLNSIVDREEERVLPRLEKIKEQFTAEPLKVLLVTGPSNEMSIGKILTEFGSEVVIVPTMRNKFAQREKETLRGRYGSRITFHEQDYDTVAQLTDLYKPDVIFADFQGRVEVAHRLLPCLINENYLTEYGYDYALDFGEHFFQNLKKPVFNEWQDLMARYGGGVDG
jgi:nitrogenase molybdenum-iron protein alpha/beta subunit